MTKEINTAYSYEIIIKVHVTMKVIYNNIIPFKGFSAMNLFGVIFARKEYYPISNRTVRHETIHSFQMKELLYIGFYIIYLLEWLIRILIYPFTKTNPYRSISFEQEAYKHQDDQDYASTRKPFAQWRKKQ